MTGSLCPGVQPARVFAWQVWLNTHATCPHAPILDREADRVPLLLQDTEFSAKVSEHLVDLLEAMAARGVPLAWVASCKDAAALPVCLRQAGAFDHQVAVGASMWMSAGVAAGIA
jgi:hypothetical protein